MNRQEVELIVKMTVAELLSKQCLKTDSYPDTLKMVSEKLHEYFEGGEVTGLDEILSNLKNDNYIDIIYLQYRDGETIEKIAEIMGKDTSTIKRNKKRLITTIKDLLD